MNDASEPETNNFSHSLQRKQYTTNKVFMLEPNDMEILAIANTNIGRVRLMANLNG